MPTARELGVDVVLDAWRGIAVPRVTPRQVVSQLDSAIRMTASSPDFIAQSEKLNVRPAFLPAEEFSALVAKEDAELSRLMQQIGLKK